MTARTDAIRTVDGLELPAPGTWKVDPGHAEVAFVGRHFMLTKVRGRFTGVEAIVSVADRLEESAISATIDMASVSSGDAARDEHLRSSDFFDVDTWPTASFAGESISWSGTRGVLSGLLTIKGVERRVTFDVAYLGHVRDPWDNDRIVFDAAARLDREDWGLTWNVVLDAGGLLVSKEIDIELHLEFVRVT